MTTEEPKIIEMTAFGPLVETADGSYTIRHAVHGQDFHSSEGARYEAWELYVVASGLFEKLQGHGDALKVLDVGMGLAYNACATISAWLESPGTRQMEIISLEIDPQLVRAIAGGQAPWCRGWRESWLMGPNKLGPAYDNVWLAELIHPNSSNKLLWSVVVSDASRSTVPEVVGGYNFIWQDPFTPELNPAMWSTEWFARIRSLAAENVILMTYSVSRVVKNALEESGWRHTRFRTPGRKRHWLRAW